jgi:hypothetical protein
MTRGAAMPVIQWRSERPVPCYSHDLKAWVVDFKSGPVVLRECLPSRWQSSDEWAKAMARYFKELIRREVVAEWAGVEPEYSIEQYLLDADLQ